MENIKIKYIKITAKQYTSVPVTWVFPVTVNLNRGKSKGHILII